MKSKTKTQYLAQVMHRMDESEEKWTNAIIYYKGYLGKGMPRLFTDIDKAKKSIEDAIETNKPTGKAYSSRMNVNGIGIDCEVDEKTQSNLEIVRTRILKREVTEWEEV